MRTWKRWYKILKRTGTLKIFMSFLLFLCGAGVVLALVEPQIQSFGDGLWYCFVAAATIGFGDIYAVTKIGRLVTVLVSLYGILMAAMVPGVVVSYYMEHLKIREKETISVFLEELERLPELSKEELEELSEKIKKFNHKH
ncbi:MAG: two pore domain potassium channel family protein [Lachnospiraceae bacterium]|nr:two pore domain potassium channel family protein [Lachnospiraceae bacterium]